MSKNRHHLNASSLVKELQGLFKKGQEVDCDEVCKKISRFTCFNVARTVGTHSVFLCLECTSTWHFSLLTSCL